MISHYFINDREKGQYFFIGVFLIPGAIRLSSYPNTKPLHSQAMNELIIHNISIGRSNHMTTYKQQNNPPLQQIHLSTMQATNAASMQTNDDCKMLVPTKTDSRTSDTQRRMYSRPNGVAYQLLTKDAVTYALEELYRYGQLDLSGKVSPTSVMSQSMSSDIGIDFSNLDPPDLRFNSSHPRAA